MKIRSDFVTNSSSVSYIISLNADMIDFIKAKNKNFVDSPKKGRIFKLLSEDIITNGQKIELYDKELYMKKYDFSKKPDCKYDQSFDKPIEEVDFSEMSDKDMWAYIYGEYFVNARLSEEISGFGSLLVPRNVEILKKKKHCITTTCDVCTNKDTEDCLKVLRDKILSAEAK